MYRRRWRRAGPRGVAAIIATILLVAMTLTAGVVLWTFRITTPPAYPAVNFVLRTGGSNPVWGDPTDTPPHGGYSLMNTSQIIVSTYSPNVILLSQITLTFICDNASSGGNITTLVTGTLAQMTWFPGLTSDPPAGAPELGWCASFHAGGYGGGAFGTAYNRLGMFIPITGDNTTLAAGDTYLLYIHNGGYPLDYDDCKMGVTQCLDSDDYHGAPPWCFTDPGACTIYLQYTGSPSTLLASIPVYSLAPPH
ncbi:MAG TPA: archaellin/type IV pilin N-terminal domain-containing protein [Thermoplasmata archaeon]|nr:archaellin/type IV pilin N-terminal domain-containing protein [Thermoplasmata archaeon]